MAAAAATVVVITAAAAPAGAVTVQTFSGLTSSSLPTRIAPGSDGNLWFSQAGTTTIGRVSTAGAVTEFPAPGGVGSGPFGMAAGGDGFVYFTLATANGVGRISPAGTTSSDPAGTNGLEDIAAGPDGRLWFAENAGNKIHAYEGTTPVPSFLVPTPGSGPSGIAAGPDGNLWFTESATSAIGRIATDGNFLPEFPLPTPSSGPSGIAAGPDGNMWVALKSIGRIARITPAGVVHEFPVLPAGSNSQPTSIVAGPDGNMWFTEANASRIGRITMSGVVTEFTSGANPTGITVGPDGNVWFVLRNGNKVGRATTDLQRPRYTNPDPIAVPGSGTSGPAGAYPSTIEASGLPGTVTEVSVRLNGVHHPNVDDLEALLVGPQGQKVVLLADSAGGGANRDIGTGQVVTFDDDGPTSSAKLVSGIFKPVVQPGPTPDFALPAPAGPHATSLSVFDGTNPNGTWQLFLQDDSSTSAGGTVVEGWSLDIETTGPTVQVPGPTIEVPGPEQTVTEPGPTTTVTVPGPADSTKPGITLGTLAGRMPQATFRKGLSVRVTPSEPVTLDVELSVKPTRVTVAAVDSLTLFERTVSANRATKIAVKPSARRLGRPRKTFRAVLRIVATDAGGNRTTVSKTITVTPDKRSRRR